MDPSAFDSFPSSSPAVTLGLSAPDPSAAATAPSCSKDCILAFSLATSGILLAGVVLSAFFIHRRRRILSTTTSTKNNVGGKSRKPSLTGKSIEGGGGNTGINPGGVFMKYFSPTTASRPRSRLDEDDDDDLVDVLDLFDPPMSAHLRSPGPRRLTLTNTGGPLGGIAGIGWGPEWKFLTENNPATSMASSKTSDKIGIHTMLGSSVSPSTPGSGLVYSYAARTPVLVPKNLDVTRSPSPGLSPRMMMTMDAYSNSHHHHQQQQHPVANAPAGLGNMEARSRTMMREKRPPPLNLHMNPQTRRPTTTRPAYISITAAGNGTPYKDLPKPPLSPITPLLTPKSPMIFVNGVQRKSSYKNSGTAMRVPSATASEVGGTSGVSQRARRLTASRNANEIPVELVRKSIDQVSAW